MTDKAELGKTEQQLMAALERLIAKTPTNRELKQKLKNNKLKIAVSNVEKEAGLSNGAAKHYPAIKELIEIAERDRIYGISEVADTVVKSQPLYIKTKEDLVKAKEEIKKLKADLAVKNQKIDEYKRLLKEQAVMMHSMNVAMWQQIPFEKKNIKLMQDVQGNVINFKS